MRLRPDGEPRAPPLQPGIEPVSLARNANNVSQKGIAPPVSGNAERDRLNFLSRIWALRQTWHKATSARSADEAARMRWQKSVALIRAMSAKYSSEVLGLVRCG